MIKVGPPYFGSVKSAVARPGAESCYACVFNEQRAVKQLIWTRVTETDTEQLRRNGHDTSGEDRRVQELDPDQDGNSFRLGFNGKFQAPTHPPYRFCQADQDC